MKYTVSVRHSIVYTLEVEADGFDSAAEEAAEKARGIGDSIDLAASPVLPDEVAEYTDYEVVGINKE